MRRMLVILQASEVQLRVWDVGLRLPAIGLRVVCGVGGGGRGLWAASQIITGIS